MLSKILRVIDLGTGISFGLLKSYSSHDYICYSYYFYMEIIHNAHIMSTCKLYINAHITSIFRSFSIYKFIMILYVYH